MMEHLSENRQGQDDHSVEQVVTSEMAETSLGKTLREAREHLGLSIADVAAQIKLAPRQIEALEADDFKHLPEMAFVRGFVRSYAKLLKLDAQALLAPLAQAKVVSADLVPAPVGVTFPDARLMQRKVMVWSGAAMILVVLVAGFAVRSCTVTRTPDKVMRVETPVSLPVEVQVAPDATSMKPEVVVPSVSAGMNAKTSEVSQSSARSTKPVMQTLPKAESAGSAVQAVPSAQSGTLRLEFDEESWVEIKDKDGNILASQAYQPGSDLRLEGNAPFSLLIGHAPSVRLYYRDKQVDLAPHTRRSTQVAHLILE